MGDEKQSRDATYWAKPVAELHLGHELPADAVNLNVEGKRVAGLVGGFGKMWQKTYSIEIPEVDPKTLIQVWKEHFRYFWPKHARFFGPAGPVAPGDVALLNLKMPGGVKMSTGVLVLYADDESFSFMTPEGHMFVGMITFSARAVDDKTVAQIQLVIRAQDPLYEIGMLLGGHRMEDRHWKHTLESLARYFGADAKADMRRVLVDKRRQWKHFGNIRRSAAIRSAAYSFTAPFRRSPKVAEPTPPPPPRNV